MKALAYVALRSVGSVALWKTETNCIDFHVEENWDDLFC